MRFSPMVVVLPGMSYDIMRYNYLLKRLAKNGFLAVSIDSVTNGSVDAAADALSFLTSLRTKWGKRNFIDHSRVGLIGHSRGGGSVLDLAQDLENPAHTWSVEAIVTIAPRYDSLAVDPGMSPALLTLQGTHDGDMIPYRSFQLYDDSGNEGSAFANGVERAMKLFQMGDHRSLVMSEHFPPAAPTSDTVGSTVARGYALAFMAHHLQDDDTWYDDYIRGNYQPGDWPHDVDSQFTDGSLRFSVDNAEHGNVTPAASNVALSNRDLGGDMTTYHDTRVYEATVNGSGGTITWSFGGQNLNYYDVFSLRLGQLASNLTDDVEVSIRSDGSWSAPVRLADHGRIARPSTMCDRSTAEYTCWPTYLETRLHMSTIRVPLEAFGTLGTVDGVRLTFSGNTLQETFYIDSLDFSTWAGQ